VCIDNIEYLRLPKSDLIVSRICFGGEQLGGFGLGDYDVKDTIRAAKIALERGINFFDTADCYNLGESERNLSRVIPDRKREKIIIGSKFGVRFINNSRTNRVFYDNSIKWIDEALKGSLSRLQTDYLDLYQVHYWDNKTPLEEVFSHLERKCEMGIIRYYGVSNMKNMGTYAKDYPHLITFSNELSLVNRNNEKIIEANIENGFTFLAFGALGQGILTGKYNLQSSFNNNDRRSSEKYINFHGDKLKKNLEIINKMRTITYKRKGVSLSQVAIKWILSKLKNTVVITGIKNLKQLEDNLHSFSWELSSEDRSSLNNLG